MRFELGQWVKSEDGIGQIIWIRPLNEITFFPLNKYEKEKIDEFGNYKYIFIIKFFLNNKFKILNNFYFGSCTESWIRPLNFDEIKDLNELKKDKKEKYYKYLTYDEFTSTKYFGEIFYVIPRINIDQIKLDLLEFKKSVIGKYFYIDDLKLFLSERKSKLNFDDFVIDKYFSELDKETYKVLVLQFFTSNNTKVVNNKLCFLDFNNLWR